MLRLGERFESNPLLETRRWLIYKALGSPFRQGNCYKRLWWVDNYIAICSKDSLTKTCVCARARVCVCVCARARLWVCVCFSSLPRNFTDTENQRPWLYPSGWLITVLNPWWPLSGPALISSARQWRKLPMAVKSDISFLGIRRDVDTPVGIRVLRWPVVVLIWGHYSTIPNVIQ